MKRILVTLMLVTMTAGCAGDDSSVLASESPGKSFSSTYECVHYVVGQSGKTERAIGHLLTDTIEFTPDDVGAGNRVLGLPLTVGSAHWPEASVLGYESAQGGKRMCLFLNQDGQFLAGQCAPIDGKPIYIQYEPEDGAYQKAVLVCHTLEPSI